MTIRKLFRAGACAAVVILTSSCELLNATAVGQIDDLVLNSGNKTCLDNYLEPNEKGAAKAAADRGPTDYKIKSKAFNSMVNELLNPFGGPGEQPDYNALLDCVFGNIAASGNARQQRLLRAHMMVTLIARYGAFNITGDVGGIRNTEFADYDEITEDASTLMARIEVVQDMLRIAAYKADKAAGGAAFANFKRDTSASVPAVKLSNLEYLKRVNLRYLELAILQLVLDAETPTYRRVKKSVRSVIGAVLARNPSAAKPALSAALSGLAKAAVLDRFAGAYVGDANEYGGAIHTNGYAWDTAKTPAPGHWADWDALLTEACDRLAEKGDIKNHCLNETEAKAARKKLNGT